MVGTVVQLDPHIVDGIARDDALRERLLDAFLD